MLDERTSHRVRSVLAAAAGTDRLPIGELVALATEATTDLTIDVAHDPPLVMIRPRRDPVFDGLSAREVEVAALVAAGRRNADIAAELFSSTATVKDHVHAILRKTGLSGRSAVIAAWHGQGNDPSASRR